MRKAAVAGDGRMIGGFPGLLFHVTRGLLPKEGEDGEPRDIIERNARRYRDMVNAALDA